MHTTHCSLQVVLLIGILILPGINGYAQSTGTQIYGTVVDGNGEALPYVNVILKGSVEGAATDQRGAFEFTTLNTGACTIIVSMIGYEPVIRNVELVSGEPVEVHVVLRETLINMEEAVVTASSYVTGIEDAATLQPLEVVTTPGAAADILLAIKTFPGTAMVDEGAGLFVRGGDVDETVLHLDQATVIHPYKYESPTGGVFGTIPPFLVDGTYFSSGGFSAKYGNALSGMLAMKSQNLPLTSTYTFNLGLAAASVGLDLPLIPGKLGVRFSGNRSFTKLMMNVNRIADEFVQTPRGWDGNLSVVYAYSSTGQVKFFNFSTFDRIGVLVDEPSFEAIFRGESLSRLHNVQWSDILGPWFLEASGSLSNYKANREIGVLDIEQADWASKVRVDVEREPLNERLRLFSGVEIEQLVNDFTGILPVRNEIVDPHSTSYGIDSRNLGTRLGGYGEVEYKWTRRIATRVGGRFDKLSLSSQWTVDPRASLLYAINPSTEFRLAWGLYHQYALPYQYDAVSSLRLRPQRSQHYIAGVHFEKADWQARLEGYIKPYENLVLENDQNEYENAGDGLARGVDVFVKYGGFLQTRVNGWLSYSYLTSNRTQLRYTSTGAVFEKGPSPFDISHNLTLVAKARVVGFWSTGFTFRHATGRPITPITNALFVEDQGYFLPIEGPVGSERLPAFQRLDMNVSYYLPFGGGHNATFYCAVSNLLNRTNVLDYNYSADYSQRTERRSNYQRFVYFGVAVNIKPFAVIPTTYSNLIKK